MKKTKLVSGLTMVVMSAMLLGACSADKPKDDAKNDTATSEVAKDGAMKDGTYKLKEKNDNNGYHAVFELTVKGDKITESKFDYLDKDGKSKKDDAKYNETMKAKSGTSPDEYIDKLNEELVSTQNVDSVDVVTGATHSSSSFKEYAAKLVDAAKKGDTKEIVIDNKVD